MDLEKESIGDFISIVIAVGESVSRITNRWRYPIGCREEEKKEKVGQWVRV